MVGVSHKQTGAGPCALQLTPGADTNNEASRAYYAQDPDGDSDSHSYVSCDVAIQTAKPRTLEEVVNLEVGEHEGNRECSIEGVRPAGRFKLILNQRCRR